MMLAMVPEYGVDDGLGVSEGEGLAVSDGEGLSVGEGRRLERGWPYHWEREPGCR